MNFWSDQYYQFQINFVDWVRSVLHRHCLLYFPVPLGLFYLDVHDLGSATVI